MKYEGLFIRIETAIERDPARALDEAVRLLAAEMPTYTWVGIYLLEGEELVLGPFVGKPSPHTRIPLGRGICGAAATHKETIVVDDVNADPRYLACFTTTRSEIVVPIFAEGQVIGEIDIDGSDIGAYDENDARFLEEVAALLAPLHRAEG